MTSEELDKTIGDFSQELSIDFKLDQLNAMEKVGLMPSIRHKWVARLIRLKQSILVLQRRRRLLIADVVLKSKQQRMPVQLSERALASTASLHPTIVEIDDSLSNIDLLVQYLEKVEKVMLAMGHDARNLVDLIKMETL